MAFEERSPRAPLLVLPNGASLPAEVRALKRVGFSGAIALHDALGVPSRTGGAASASATAAAAADPADASAQEGMLERRQALADSFVRNMRGDGAAAAAKAAAAAAEEEEDEDDDGFEDAGGETSELGVPLLVTTELAARGVDFKAMCASLRLPHAHGHYHPGLPAPTLPSPPSPPPSTPHSLATLHTHRRPKCCRCTSPPRRRLPTPRLTPFSTALQ